MVEKFIAFILAKVSEQVLNDIFKAIMREIVLARKKGDISQAATEFRILLNELAIEEITNEEKNAKLIDAGRKLTDSVRE